MTTANIVVFVEAKVVVRAGTSGDGAAYVRRAVFKNVSSVTYLIGAVQDDFTVEDQAPWDVTFVISTHTIQLQVTGENSKSITWWYEINFIPTATTII